MQISDLKEKNILLLSGGWSAEREISIKSGKAVESAFIKNQLTFTHLDLRKPEGAGEISEDFDIAFIALHGRGGEDGFIQEILESKRISYTGSNSLACKTSLNKIEAKKIWRDLFQQKRQSKKF